MMMRIVFALLALLCLQDVASARPHHHRHHHRHHVANVAPAPPQSFLSRLFSGGGSDVVSQARRYIGSGPVFGRGNLWCARFINVVLKQTGHRGTNSDAAMSFASMPATTMHVGAIAVMGRRGGGHVGIVSGVDSAGNPIIISGNNGNRVRETSYPRGRIIKFVSPT